LAGAHPRLIDRLEKVSEELFPGYFAFVMATGIVGVAAFMIGLPFLPEALFVISALAQVWLLGLTAYRALRFPKRLLSDFKLFPRSPAFFTTIAAFGVLGSYSIRLFGDYSFALGCWYAGAALWLVLTYAFALCMMTATEKPPVESAVNGIWLVLVVATQALSVLGSLLSDRGPEWLFFVSACLFMIGCALYLLLISLLSLRLLLRVVEPEALTPPYWIMMGAAAISTLAGVELDRHAQAWSLQIQALPVLQGFTLFFWIAASGWMPLLVLLGFWRHVVRRHTFRYEPQLWSVVFPLGMYSVATSAFAADFNLAFLDWVPKVFAVIALAAWLATFYGMVRASVATLFMKNV
jgi:tellurite resistance protein TehA-like permease